MTACDALHVKVAEPLHVAPNQSVDDPDDSHDTTSDEMDTIEEQTAAPVRKAGQYVRCLGWENLNRSMRALSLACTRTFEKLDVPYIVSASIGGLGHAFMAEVQQPSGSKSMQMQVCIFAASEGCTTKHHVSLRRITGDCLRLRSFYTSFRAVFSAQLGFLDASALTTFSPLKSRRVPAPIAMQPATMSTRIPAVPELMSAISPPSLLAVDAATANSCPGQVACLRLENDDETCASSHAQAAPAATMRDAAAGANNGICEKLSTSVSVLSSIRCRAFYR